MVSSFLFLGMFWVLPSVVKGVLLGWRVVGGKERHGEQPLFVSFGQFGERGM